MADRDRDNGQGENSRPSLLGRFKNLPNDSPAKAVIMTLLVSLVASVLVAGSAVWLRPLHLANIQLEQKKRILEIVGGAPRNGKETMTDASALKTRVVDLATGNYRTDIDAASFDQRKAATDPARSLAIPRDKDIAQLQKRAKYAAVYVLEKDGRPQLIVLPVHGKGFGSTLYGYLGLSGDTKTVIGLAFYEHGETPGLGALIDEPGWRAQWRGKKTWDASGELQLGVAPGKVAADDADAPYRVDALTGATWTSRGVTNLLRYWLGEHGFGPYLRKLREQRGPA